MDGRSYFQIHVAAVVPLTFLSDVVHAALNSGRKAALLFDWKAFTV